MKLMAILSLVFAQYFESINGGKGAFQALRLSRVPIRRASSPPFLSSHLFACVNIAWGLAACWVAPDPGAPQSSARVARESRLRRWG